MTTEFAARKNEECYDHVYILHHPDEERPACRPLRTAPAYDRQKARGAQFGLVNGWERPNYFGPLDAPDSFDHDARSFRRGGWWQYAVDEAKAIREGVGLIDATAFTKHVVKGPGATAVPRLVHLQQAAARRADQPDLCADRRTARRAPNTPSCGLARTTITWSRPGPGQTMTPISCARPSRTRWPSSAISRSRTSRRNGASSPSPGRNRATC